MKALTQLAIGLSMLFSAHLSLASVIVDTRGDNWFWSSLVMSGSFSQSVAMQFTLDQSFSITAILPWVIVRGTDAPGYLNISIYDNNNESLPGNELFSDSVYTEFGTGYWHGLTDLNWNLNAGTYWATFSSGAWFRGSILNGADDTSLRFASNGYPTNVWQPMSVSIAVRIEGAPAPVPLLPAELLLASGFPLLLALKRQRKRQR